jgi:hypothetical protein
MRYHKDPVAQLQKLAKQQSEVLLQKLGSGDGADADTSDAMEIPTRLLPFGSEEFKLPTHITQSSTVLSPQPVKPGAKMKVLASEHQARLLPTTEIASTIAIPKPGYTGPGLVFEKGEDIPTRETPALPTEEEQDALETWPGSDGANVRTVLY